MKRTGFLGLVAAVSAALAVNKLPAAAAKPAPSGVGHLPSVNVTPAMMPWDTASITIDGRTYTTWGGPGESVAERIVAQLNRCEHFNERYIATLEGRVFTIAVR